MKKKLLVYAHYYYPDVAATGQILTELCDHLKNTFDITVICAVPSYTGQIEEMYKTRRFCQENHNGCRIIRVRVPEFQKNNKVSRIKNLVSYFVHSAWATLKVEKPDYIFSMSQPPVLGGLLGVIGKSVRGGKLIYNIQDFNPEQTMAVGYAKNKWILKLALMLDKFSCSAADKVIVVGRDMQETLNNRYQHKNVPGNVFINNWVNEEEIYPLIPSHPQVLAFKKKNNLLGKFVIMYSGNLGLYYDLENIIKVIEKFKHQPDVAFVFIGEGSVKKVLEEYVETNELKHIRFIPYQPKEALNYSLNAADVHWVVNAKGIKGISVPSKLYGVMAAGKPVLGVLEEGSEARLIIEEAGCGICTIPGNYKVIQNHISYILKNKELLAELGRNGRSYLEANLRREVSVDRYRQEIINS